MSLPRPIAVLTNNPPQFATPDSMYRDGIAGQATVPVVRTYENLSSKGGNDLLDALFKMKLSDLNEPTWEYANHERRGLIAELFPIEEVLPSDLDIGIQPVPKSGTSQNTSDAFAKILAAIKMSALMALQPRTAYIPPVGPIKTWLTSEFNTMAWIRSGFSSNWMNYNIISLNFRRIQKKELLPIK